MVRGRDEQTPKMVDLYNIRCLADSAIISSLEPSRAPFYEARALNQYLNMPFLKDFGTHQYSFTRNYNDSIRILANNWF